MTSHQGYILSTLLIVDVDLRHLSEMVFVRLLCFKIILCFPYCSLWKEVTICSPHRGVGSSVSLRAAYEHRTTWNSSAWKIYPFFSFSPPFLYLLLPLSFPPSFPPFLPSLFFFISIDLWIFVFYFAWPDFQIAYVY